MMSVVKKWDFFRRFYDDVVLPDAWHVSCYESDMAALVNCPHCGSELPYGKTLTSRQFHSPNLGFGYGVCEECYATEWRIALLAAEAEEKRFDEMCRPEKCFAVAILGDDK